VLPCSVRVIEPSHPLFGRTFEATAFRHLQGELRLVAVLPDGAPGTIPAEATDILGGEAEAGDTDLQQLVLTLDGVRRLRALVEAKSRGPKSRGTRSRAT